MYGGGSASAHALRRTETMLSVIRWSGQSRLANHLNLWEPGCTTLFTSPSRRVTLSAPMLTPFVSTSTVTMAGASARS